MMPSLVDHVADRSGAELARLARQYEFPPFVKQASLEQTMTPGSLPAHLYADPVRKQFPCHTAASTWLSALYFTEKAAEFHPKERVKIGERLDHYASYWRIRPAVREVSQRWEDLHKSAEEQLPDSAYAYVWVGEDGRKDRHLPLRSAAEVKAAAEYVETYRDRFDFPTRNTMAKKILTKAAQFGAAVGGQREFLEKQAGMGVCDPGEVVGMIQNRALLVRHQELREHFLKMASTIKATPRRALQPDMLEKLAATMDTLDRQLGLVGKYSDILPRPEDVIFKATFSKVAADLAQTVATTSGKVYEKQALKKVALEDLRSLFGQEFAERVGTPLGDVDSEKLAEEVGTLPRPDAELLDGLLGDSGIRPLLRKAASARQGFTPAEQAAWAAAYRSIE